mgnify:CR=1 FL=1
MTTSKDGFPLKAEGGEDLLKGSGRKVPAGDDGHAGSDGI